jgi:hypothetical protein
MTDRQRLERAMRTLGWTDAELARRLHIAKNTVTALRKRDDVHPALLAWVEAWAAAWAAAVARLPEFPDGWIVQQQSTEDEG